MGLGGPPEPKIPDGGQPLAPERVKVGPRGKSGFLLYFFFAKSRLSLHARRPSEKNEVERNFFAPKPPKLAVSVKSGQGNGAAAPGGLRDAGGLRQPPRAPPPPSPSLSPAVPSGSAGAHFARLGLA